MSDEVNTENIVNVKNPDRSNTTRTVLGALQQNHPDLVHIVSFALMEFHALSSGPLLTLHGSALPRYCYSNEFFD